MLSSPFSFLFSCPLLCFSFSSSTLASSLPLFLLPFPSSSCLFLILHPPPGFSRHPTLLLFVFSLRHFPPFHSSSTLSPSSSFPSFVSPFSLPPPVFHFLISLSHLLLVSSFYHSLFSSLFPPSCLFPSPVSFHPSSPPCPLLPRQSSFPHYPASSTLS